MIDTFKVTIRNWLEEKYDIGTHAGGSGHLGTISLEILETSLSKKKGRIVVSTIYEISAVTEFTYFPDNPPKYTRYRRTFELDGSGDILDVSDAKTIATNIGVPSDDLNDIQE